MHKEAQDSVFTPDVHVVLDTVDQYLQTGKSFNRWIEAGAMKVYIRRQKTIPHRNLGIKDSLCVAHVVIEEYARGQGFFKEVLDGLERKVERMIPGGVLYLENVGNDRLAAYLRGRGYSQKNIGEDSQSYYKVMS